MLGRTLRVQWEDGRFVALMKEEGGKLLEGYGDTAIAALVALEQRHKKYETLKAKIDYAYRYSAPPPLSGDMA